MNDRIRVLQVTHDLGVGGLPRVVSTLSTALEPSRFDVRVLCLNALGPLADALRSRGIPVDAIHTDHRADYGMVAKVWKYLSRHPTDVVHTHNTQPFLEAGLAARLARVPGHIHTDHGRAWPDARRYMLAERWMSRATQRVVAVSEATRDDLIQYEGISPDRITVIENGIDPAPFADAFDADAFRHALAPGRRPLVAVVGRLTEEKGTVYAVEAMPALRETYPEITLLVAGEGDRRRALEQRAAALGVADAVRFLGARSDVPRILRAIDVLVLPSRREGLPMVVLEAMAAQCPIVASAVGGVPRAIPHEEAGLLIPPEDPDAIVGAVHRLLSESLLAERLVEAALGRFERSHSARAMAEAYERLYEVALEGRTGGG